MQETDHETTCKMTITTSKGAIRKHQSTRHRYEKKKKSIQHWKEEKIMITWEGEEKRLERRERSPMSTLKERNIKLGSLEHDTILPHATYLLPFKSFSSTTTNEKPCIQPTKRQAPPPIQWSPMLPWVGQLVMMTGASCTYTRNRQHIFPAKRHEDNLRAGARTPARVNHSRNQESTMRLDNLLWIYKKRCWCYGGSNSKDKRIY